MSADPVFKSRPGRQLLWAICLLAMLWLALIAWQKPPLEGVQADPAPRPASRLESPARPAFEDMLAAVTDQRSLAPAQWQNWQELTAKAVTAAQSAGNPSNALKDAQANLQLLGKELGTQLEAARNMPQLIWLQLRLSRANPQLRLYEQERVEIERAPADLSRLLLRLFAAALPADSLEPNWLAYEASCPVWGEISQAIGQLQKDVETPKGRRSDLARRSLSTLEQPSLIAPIHAQAAQCASVIESRKAVATLAKVLAQVPWAEVFVITASAPVPGDAMAQAGSATDSDRAAAPWLSVRWVPVALCLGLICLLVLGLTSRARQRDFQRAHEDLQDEAQRLRRQIEQLRSSVAQQQPSTPSEPTPSGPTEPGPIPRQAQETAGVPTAPQDGLMPALDGPPAQALEPQTDRGSEPQPSRARIEQARDRLCSAQLGLIQGLSAQEVLHELDQAQALLDPDPAAQGQKGPA